MSEIVSENMIAWVSEYFDEVVSDWANERMNEYAS